MGEELLGCFITAYIYSNMLTDVFTAAYSHRPSRTNVDSLRSSQFAEMLPLLCKHRCLSTGRAPWDAGSFFCRDSCCWFEEYCMGGGVEVVWCRRGVSERELGEAWCRGCGRDRPWRLGSCILNDQLILRLSHNFPTMSRFLGIYHTTQFSYIK